MKRGRNELVNQPKINAVFKKVQVEGPEGNPVSIPSVFNPTNEANHLPLEQQQ